MTMEATHVASTASEPIALGGQPTGNNQISIYLGTSVLIYIVLLCALAPKQLPLNRRKS